MTGKAPDPSRNERLASKLRENLRRRKAQARAQAPDETAPDAPPDNPANESPSPAHRESQGNGLSKSAPKS